MAFQTTVNRDLGLGVVGEIFAQGPTRAQSFMIDSPDAANNVFGRACTVTAEGTVRTGGTGVFAGILVNPKVSALYGTTAGGALAPSLTLANKQQCEVLSMGSIIISLAAEADIGDLVVYNTTTGILATIAPGDPLPANSAFANAVVDYKTVTAAGLAIITLSPQSVIPEAAP